MECPNPLCSTCCRRGGVHKRQRTVMEAAAVAAVDGPGANLLDALAEVQGFLPEENPKWALTVMEVAACVAVEAPGVNLLHVLAQAQRLAAADGAVETGAARIAGAVRVTFRVAPQAGALRDEAFVLEAASVQSSSSIFRMPFLFVSSVLMCAGGSRTP